MADIVEIHESCLDFLLECQLKDENFFFVPRKINNKNRLEQGMYFRGNEHYLALSFWDNSDSKEFIYNINWSCDASGVSSIELSCRDNDDILPYIIKIKELLESHWEGKKEFKETKKNRWRYIYDKDIHYINTLQEFILDEKPVIDDYLRKHPESGIPLANRDTDDKYVKTLPYYSKYIDSIKKDKKIGTIKVKASEYIMSLQHNELSNAMVEYLKNNGYKNIKVEENYVDIKCIDKEGKKIFYELKTARTVKSAIRDALGQLLEYNHYPNTKKADKLIIVTKYAPEEQDQDIQYLQGLRRMYNIPIYYQYFDMKVKILSKEF